MKANCSTICFFLMSLGTVAQTGQYQILVQNRNSHSIQLYSQSGVYIQDFIGSGSGGLSAPEDILFLPDSTLLVTGNNNTAIKQYNAFSGDFIGDFTSGYALSNPSKMSIGPDSLIYVTQWGTAKNKIVRFTMEGLFVDEFTQVAAPKGLGHVWDEDGNFYVALFGNGGDGTIQKFDGSGNDLGEYISGLPLQGPTDIWWGANGELFIEDWTSGKVLRYDSSGQFLNEFISSGLSNPEGIAFTPDGKILIGDWGKDQVLQYDTSGNYLGVFASGNDLGDPNGVHVHPFNLAATAVEGFQSRMPDLFFLYPNPSYSQTWVQLMEGTAPDELSYELTDTDGKILRSGHPGTPRFPISLHDLPTGIYFLRVCSSGNYSVKKIIKY